jgi:outer membrane biosynthesis protein TonB
LLSCLFKIELFRYLSPAGTVVFVFHTLVISLLLELRLTSPFIFHSRHDNLHPPFFTSKRKEHPLTPTVAMAEEQRPVATETPAVEPTPAVTETPAAEPAAEPAPASTTETPAEAPAEEIAAAPAEERITKTEKPVEPIYSGALGYKAPGLVK